MSEQKNILLVDDDAFMNDIYQTKLGQEGFNVVVAENGAVALKKLEKNIPNLVLLDIVMPYMDGIEVLKKLKENEKWKNIPVILLTNLSEKGKVEEGVNMGANDYLIKSHFTPAEVINKIRALLK